MCSLFYLKAKSKEKRQTNCLLVFRLKPFLPFLKNKTKYKTNFNFEFILYNYFFYVKEKCLQTFKKNYCPFDFLKIKTLSRVFGKIRRFFGIELIKI